MASFERYHASNITSVQTIHTSNASDAAQADILIGMTISKGKLFIFAFYLLKFFDNK